MRCSDAFFCSAKEGLFYVARFTQLNKAQGESATVSKSNKLTGNDRQVGATNWEQNHSASMRLLAN